MWATDLYWAASVLEAKTLKILKSSVPRNVSTASPLNVTLKFRVLLLPLTFERFLAFLHYCEGLSIFISMSMTLLSKGGPSVAIGGCIMQW